MILKKLLLLALSLILGILVVFQIKSINDIDSMFLRENEVNFYEEILSLKSTNVNLSNQVKKLENNLDKLSDQNMALFVIEDEIKEYKMLDGKNPIFGPGITIYINGDIKIDWLTDLVNEIKNAGAEAISVNGFRIKIDSGFNVIPNGQIMLDNEFISSPYAIKAISNSSVLESILKENGSIISRFKQIYPQSSINIEKNDVIQM